MIDTKEQARTFRKMMTLSENRLWYYLRDRRLGGYKFVRELPIGPYIADFVCRQKKIIVEVDGGQHNDRIGYDANRTKFLETKGYRVMRVWSNEVMNNIQGVSEAILNFIENVPADTPSPLDPSPLAKSCSGRGERANS